jgi:hypothetical protein
MVMKNIFFTICTYVNYPTEKDVRPPVCGIDFVATDFLDENAARHRSFGEGPLDMYFFLLHQGQPLYYNA